MTENNTNTNFKYSTDIGFNDSKGWQRIEKALNINGENGHYSNDKYQIDFDFDMVFIKFAESDHQFIREILNKITEALELKDEYKIYEITDDSSDEIIQIKAYEDEDKDKDKDMDMFSDSHSDDSDSDDYSFEFKHNLPGKDFLISAESIKAKFTVTILRKNIPCYIVDIETIGSYIKSSIFVKDYVETNVKLNNLEIDSDIIDLLEGAVCDFDDESIFEHFNLIIMDYFSSLLVK